MSMAFTTLRKEPEKVLKAADYQRKVIADCLLLKQTRDAQGLVAAWPENETKVWMLTTLGNRATVLEDNVRRHAEQAARMLRKEVT